MAPRNPNSAQTSTVKELRPIEKKKPSKAERSAHLARREAAKVLRSTLRGDARRRDVGSIKSRVYSLSVRNKEATFALVCQTLKHLSIIKDVLEEANVLSANWKKQPELMYIIAYDLLFGQEVSLDGDAEKYLVLKRDALQSALSRILRRKGVNNVEDLVVLDKKSELREPCYVRVNTLKILKLPLCSLNSSDTETTTMFPQLPHDVILEILVRLPVKPLLRFKCVCKSWLSVISSRRFVKTHLANSKKDTTRHKLIVSSPVTDIKQCSVPSLLSRRPIFDVVDPDPIFRVDTLYVWGSCDGLIFLDIDSGKDLILWNPSTRIHRKLPSQMYAECIYGFGFDKSSDDYKVVGIFRTNIYLKEVIVKIYSLKSNRWKTINDSTGWKDFRGWDFVGRGAYAHGKLHWISIWDLFYIDLETEEYGVLQTLDFLVESYFDVLGASDGRLFVLRKDSFASDLWFMDDFDGSGKGSWTKLVTIPDDCLCMTPDSLLVVNNGEVLLFYGWRIVIFVAKDCTSRYPNVSHGAYRFTLGEYVESLVSPVAVG